MIRSGLSVARLSVATFVVSVALGGCGDVGVVTADSGVAGGSGGKKTGGSGGAGGVAGQGAVAGGGAGSSGTAGRGGGVGPAGQGGSGGTSATGNAGTGGGGGTAGTGTVGTGGTQGAAGTGGSNTGGTAGKGTVGAGGSNTGGAQGAAGTGGRNTGGTAGTGTAGTGAGGTQGAAGTGGSNTGGTQGAAGAGGSGAGAGGAAGASVTGTGGSAAGAVGSGGTTSTGGAAGTTCGFPMPNPASVGLPNPMSYDTSTPGVVLDNVTGLAWEQTISANMYEQAGAATYCRDNRLGGWSDWRLPTVLELGTLNDVSQAQLDQKLNPAAFPNTPHEFTRVSWFQTSTPVAGEPTKSWYVNFQNGNNFIDASGAGRVRCVRVQKVSAPRCYAPGSRFVASTTGGITTKLDLATGLVWQQGVAPQVMVWGDAVSYCTGLAGGFRLPSVTEMQTLVDYTVRSPGPAMDTVAFPLTTPSGYYYWTSSPLSGVPTSAYLMDYTTGSVSWNGRNANYLARCVH